MSAESFGKDSIDFGKDKPPHDPILPPDAPYPGNPDENGK